jgi:hypothetical protein
MQTREMTMNDNKVVETERKVFADQIDRIMTRAMYQGALMAWGLSPGRYILEELVELTKTAEDVVVAIEAGRKVQGTDGALYPGFVHSMLDALRARR